MIYALVKSTDPILSQTFAPFDFTTPPMDPMELSLNLIESMRYYHGLGLSACQVGLPYRVFVMGSGDKPEDFITCYNPRLLAVSEEEEENIEGCLSFPGLVLRISRSSQIKAGYIDEFGKEQERMFSGLTARCFQHELDHLDGKLFTMYVKPLTLKLAKEKATKLIRQWKRQLLKQQKEQGHVRSRE